MEVPVIAPLSSNAFILPVSQEISHPLSMHDVPDISTSLYDVELDVPVMTSGRSFDLKDNGEINLEFAREIYSAGGLHIFSTNIPFHERVSLEELDDDGIEYGIEVTPLELYNNKRTLEEVHCFISVRGNVGELVRSWGGGNGWSGRYPLIMGNITSPNISRTSLNEYTAYRCGGGEFEEEWAYSTAGVHYPPGQLLREVYRCGEISNIIFDSDSVDSPKDVAIALGLGATAVMASKLFAGTLESPGAVHHIDNASYMVYHDQDGRKGYKRVMVPATLKSISEVMKEIADTLRIALTLTGSSNMEEFRTNRVAMKGDLCGEHIQDR